MGTPGLFNGLTQFAGNSNAVAMEQDGYGSGDLSAVSIKNDGVIVGTFSNGIEYDIATIKMAMFVNVCSLESIGDGYFLATIDSGGAIDLQATHGGIGAIYEKHLEEPVELVDYAHEKIRRAINNKETVLWISDLAFDKEWLASAALEIMLDSGDYGNLSKADIVKAKQTILSAMQQQEQSLDALEKSIENLEEVLTVLGAGLLADEVTEQ